MGYELVPCAEGHSFGKTVPALKNSLNVDLAQWLPILEAVGLESYSMVGLQKLMTLQVVC